MFAGFKCLDPPGAVRQRIASLQSTARSKRSCNIILGPFCACCFVLYSSTSIFYWSAVLYLWDRLLACCTTCIFTFFSALASDLLWHVNICLNFTPNVSHKLYFCIYLHLSICKESLEKPKNPC